MAIDYSQKHSRSCLSQLQGALGASLGMDFIPHIQLQQ